MPERTPLPYEPLTAITPLDGRYRNQVQELVPIMSEYGLIRTRMEVEARYLVALSEAGVTRRFSTREKNRLGGFITGDALDIDDIRKVKQIEVETRHDVKAMERTFRSLLKGTSLEDQVEMIHMGLTSEDVNNLAYRLMLKRGTHLAVVPALDGIIDTLVDTADQHKATPMLARTHGQAAVPTTLGKEMVVYAQRLNDQTRELEEYQLTGKLTGAVGNFNALHYAYPNIDWTEFSKKFVESLGLRPNLATTQINPYEDVIELLQNYIRVNGVLTDFNQDMWRYISDDWFVQEVKKGEVGSSTMPQKVNPIDFENSEGNLFIANSIAEGLSRKLAVSRLQRDLSDSTSMRNVGVVLGHSLVGYKSTGNGLSRVRPNTDQIGSTLGKDYAVLGEAVQTLLRKAGVDDPYSLIASMTRGEHVGAERWQEWVASLPIDSQYKEQLVELTPESYIGLAVELTERAIDGIHQSRRSK